MKQKEKRELKDEVRALNEIREAKEQIESRRRSDKSKSEEVTGK